MGCSVSRLGGRSSSDTLQVRLLYYRSSQIFQTSEVAVGGVVGGVGVGSWEREGRGGKPDNPTSSRIC